MKLIGSVWGMGLFIAIAVSASGCEDKEVTRVRVMVGDGSSGGGVDNGGSGGLGGTSAGDAGGRADTPSGDARPGDQAVEAASDVATPDVVTGPADVIGPTPVPGDYAGKPWNGAPQEIPGIVQCELYDLGGEGISYHDTEPLNRGSGELNLNINTPQAMFRRSEGVDISFTKGGTDRYMDGMALPVNELYVGWTVAGEWLKYTVKVAETGNYMISAHASANLDASTVSFTFEDGTKTPLLPIPKTGSWNIWEHVDNMAIVRLTAGLHILTLKFEAVATNNCDYFTFIRKP
ncbi:MAG TPA: carbohydrate-binding protein [Polyangia bacterium]|nr:carbohydrate-binding protein [Polyangia bacterium]